MRPQIVKILTLVLLLGNSISMLAQKAEPPAPSGQRGPGQLPIDNNIVILISFGLIYGAFIAYKRYQIKNNPQ